MTFVDLLKIYAIVVFGILTANYIHSFIFVLFKADNYEDKLAKKIAKDIKNA